MKKIIFFLAVFFASVFGVSSSYAGEDHNRLCTYTDGLYGNESFQVKFPGYTPYVNNIIKAKNKLYYVVYAQKEFAENIQEAGLYEYNCSTKGINSSYCQQNLVSTYGVGNRWF